MTKNCSWFLILLLSSCGQSIETSEQPGQLQLKLPKALQEVSGLTLLSDGRLLAVADERAQVYSIDFDSQSADKFAKFGEPAEKGDFEGITRLGNAIYLITSNGKLWRQTLGAIPTNYQTFKTGVGKDCEIEGMTAVPEKGLLLLLCKDPRKKRHRNKLTIFAWSVDEQRIDPAFSISRSFKDLQIPTLHPSAISLTADGKNLLIVAARERWFVEITLDGTLRRSGKLPNPNVHQQAEGVVITDQNTLYLADEGGKSRGTITRYDRSF